ncbi:nitroreductase family deazaflavin-dependent oxidoreductase [Blastococcus sp. SYSU DS0552]
MGAIRIGAALLLLLTALFVESFRAKWGPVQRAVRRFNRDVTNPRQLETAGQPGAYASVVHHRGRVSGAAYRTPAVAVPTDDGFLFALPYGPGADWVANVLAAGSATVEHEGRSVPVQRPRLVPADEGNRFFPPGEQRMHRLFGVVDFLRVSEAGR